MFRTARNALARAAGDWPTGVLSLALLVLATVIVCVALLPGRPLLKAAVLAWVLLP